MAGGVRAVRQATRAKGRESKSDGKGGVRAMRQAEEVQVRPRAKGRENKSDGERVCEP